VQGPSAAFPAIVAELRREARWRAIAAVAGVLAAFGLVLALSNRAAAGGTWATALALTAVAAVLAGASRRWGGAVPPVAAIAALAVALARGGPGAMHPSVGAECVATQLGCGALVVAAGWLVVRLGTSSLGRSAALGAAAAGALAGVGALELTCPAGGQLSHLLPFHVGGLLLAAAGAGAAALLLQRAARSREVRDAAGSAGPYP
jgi:hypothetical protein